jgi:hypothetical protein
MTLHEKSEAYLPTPIGSDDDALLLDAWREALAEALDTERRQWQRQRELIEAQAAATIAELRAVVAELRGEVRQMVADGLNGAMLLPPELAGQVASAARQLHEPIASERPSKVLRIERDENGALVPIYEEPQP